MNPRPRRLGFAGLLLVSGLLVWLYAAMPLLRYFNQAIPHSHNHTRTLAPTPLVAGDHLQLLYHFWLGLDAFTGRSPLFHNVYEFNLGNDAERVQPDLYYLPFSLVYMALAPWAGHAAGWNAAGLASVLLGALGAGLLARRFTTSRSVALLAALLVTALPYRWITLFSGSPTGYAMAFPPLLFYGLDRAIRDRAFSGGLLAGLMILCALMTDLHVFYFSMLAAPPFALFSLWLAAPTWRDWPGAIRRAVWPLLPCAALVAVAAGVSALANRHLAGSVMAGGRSLAEMANYSPPAHGLISTSATGMANHAYVGLPLLLLLVVGMACWVWNLRRPAPDAATTTLARRAVPFLLLATAGIIILGLGIHGPHEGIVIRVIRKIVPKYSMIRQPVKIYCLLPVTLGPLLAILLAQVNHARRGWPRAALWLLCGGLAAGSFMLSMGMVYPNFDRLPGPNAAYEAVAHDDTANAGRPPHALALPLWPGESHWASLYEYATMSSRVRLVNGYAPAVPAGYFTNVFKKYESLNQGHATDDQLDDLLAMGVRHLIFHANAFPEKVSPFPAAATLRALTGHPRLALLADDGLTFAFRILPKHPIEHTPHANWTEALYSAALQWRWDPPKEIPVNDSTRLTLRAPVFPAPDLRYLLRLAEGSTQPLVIPPAADGVASVTHPVPRLPDWLQAELPSPMGGLAHAAAGPVQLSAALLTAGDLPAPDVDNAIHIPPALLFHTGHSTPGQPGVQFRPDTVPAGRVLYGPNLPLPPGLYDITISYSFQDPIPGDIFRLLTVPARQPLVETLLDSARQEQQFAAVMLGADPICFEFHYTGKTSVTIRDIVLTPATLRLTPAGDKPATAP